MCLQNNMRVYGIDANALTLPRWTGTERYVFELLKELMKLPLAVDERIRLYAARELPELGVLPSGWELKVVQWPLGKGWTHGGLSAELVLHPPDVFFSPAHEIPVLQRAGRIVATVHDVAFRRLAEVYDQGNVRRQEWAIGRVARVADAVIAVSQMTADDLQELYLIDSVRISVVHHGVHPVSELVDLSSVLSEFGLQPRNYFLFIGRLEKKKNVATLVRAFDAWKQASGADTKLVLCGAFGFGEEEIRSAIDQSAFASDVLLPGFISEEQKYALLSQALAYTLPSYYEGFGMPVLEAMVVGAPVIASDIPVMHEVCDDAALYADPNLVDAWVRAFDVVKSDLDVREKLVHDGFARAKQFTWNSTAKKTLEVLRHV